MKLAFIMIWSVCLLSLSGGCNVVGWIANAAGPSSVQAEYVPQQQPLLVLCENYRDPGTTYVEAEQLEQLLAHELKSHDVAPIVGPEKLADLRGSRPSEFSKMSVTEIGRATGASQVLYVSMERTSLDVAQSSEMYKGASAARAKLVDVATGATLWPADAPDGRIVTVETPMVHAGETVNESSVRMGIQRALAEKIAKAFYKYQPE